MPLLWCRTRRKAKKKGTNIKGDSLIPKDTVLPCSLAPLFWLGGPAKPMVVNCNAITKGLLRKRSAEDCSPFAEGGLFN